MHLGYRPVESSAVSVPHQADAMAAPNAELGRQPRAGELTMGWRITTAIAWIGVVLGFAAVWNTSVQLGLSTWWLGPRAQPTSPLLRLAPFVAPIFMVVGTLNNVRWLGRLGVGAALVTAVFGIGDLGRIERLAVVELLIAGLALVVSIASSTGTYRRAGTASANL